MSASGLSVVRLRRVRDVLNRVVDAGDAPGAVAVIARRGEVHVEAVGALAYDGVGADTSMAADTICRISSMTKPLVSACAMTLIEDGTLRLDDPIDDLVPELADMQVLVEPRGALDRTVAAHRSITVRDLLTYTLGTGMAEGIDVTAPDGEPAAPIVEAVGSLEPPPEPEEYMRRLGEIPLLFQPGERWMYELAADVTVVLVARATAMPFGDVLHERICGPLGMRDTAFSVDADRSHRLATAYLRDATEEVVVHDGPNGLWSRPPEFESGGGGLVSSAEDYLAFASTLMTGGIHRGRRVLSRPSVALMTTDHLTPGQKAVSGFWPGYFDDIGWGFGMAVRTRRTQLGPDVGSYGWTGFYGSAWDNDPSEDMTTIFMVQQFGGRRWRLDVQAAAYQAIDD